MPGEAQTNPNHTAVSGLVLQKRLQSFGVPVELQYPGARDAEHADMQAFLFESLTIVNF